MIAIDRIAARRKLAEEVCGADAIDPGHGDVVDQLRLRTAGRGPDSCINTVCPEPQGHEAHGFYERIRTAVVAESAHSAAFRQALLACRKSGTVAIASDSLEPVDRISLGSAVAKGLTLRLGPVHAHRYMKALLDLVLRGEFDPSFVVTHRLSLDQAPVGYSLIGQNRESCIKVVLQTGSLL